MSSVLHKKGDIMNKEYKKLFGANIREIRKRQNLTQEELVTKMQLIGIDMTRSALAKIESAQRHAYPDEIKALKTALDVSYDELFDFKTDKK